MDGRDGLILTNCSEVEIVGLGQNRRLLFRSADSNIDLFDHFVAFNPHADDEYYLLVRVPNDDEYNWDESSLASVEYFLKEDFGFDDYDVHCEVEFGDEFPRSIPACWNFTISKRSDDENAPNQ